MESDLRVFTRELAPATEIHFRRVAANQEQIAEFQLPTRPTKKTDSRARGFHGESAEVDAIPPRQLREMVRECITQHVDEKAYGLTKQAEASEQARR